MKNTNMEKIISLLFVLMVSAVCFPQEGAEDTAQVLADEQGIKPVKFASWSLSKAFLAEAGRKGSYWKPTFNIAIDKNGYYCVVNLYTENDYMAIDTEKPLHLYFKTNQGGIVDLTSDADEPFHKFYLKGHYSYTGLPYNPKIWFPGQYVTRLIFHIPDIHQFPLKSLCKI